MYIDYKNRIFGLDVIRTIAILLVLCSHSTLLLFPNEEGSILTVIRFFGTVGVDLFFVLSGYLIGSMLLKQLNKGKTKFKDFVYFWIRRWFRTLPNYFLILVLNIFVFYVLYDKFIASLIGFLLFLQNFNKPHPNFFTEAWSLSIEEYAYIIGPLLVFFLMSLFNKTSKHKLFMIMTLSIIITVTLLRFNFHFNNTLYTLHDWSTQLRKVVIYRIDSIYYGFIAAFFIAKAPAFFIRFKNWFFVFGMFLFFGVHVFIFDLKLQPENASMFFNVFYLPILSFSLLLLFPMLVNWQEGKWLKYQITRVSVLSYGLYLVNYSLVLLTIQNFVNIDHMSFLFKLMVLGLYWFLSFYLSHFLYKYFEKPITDLRDSKFIKVRFGK